MLSGGKMAFRLSPALYGHPLLWPPIFGPAKSPLISCIKTPFVIRPMARFCDLRAPIFFVILPLFKHVHKLGNGLNITDCKSLTHAQCSVWAGFHKQVFIVLTNLRLLSDLPVNWFRLPLVLVQSLLLYIYNDPIMTPYYGLPVITASFFWPVGVRINGVPL